MGWLWPYDVGRGGAAAPVRRGFGGAPGVRETALLEPEKLKDAAGVAVIA